MKRIFALLFTGLAMACTGRSQDTSSLKILIIAPTKTSIDPVFIKQADSIVREMKSGLLKGSEDPEKWPDSSEIDWRSARSFIKFLQKPDIFKVTSVYASDALYMNLGYVHGLKNTLMLMSDARANNMKQLAADSGVSYIVSFPEVAFYRKNGEVNVKLKVQLYDAGSDAILISKEYSGNEFPQITEDYCGYKTLRCLLNDVNSHVASDIVDALSTVHPVLIDQKRKTDRDSTLRVQRDELLINKYFHHHIFSPT